MKSSLLTENLLMALWQGPYCSARTLGEYLGVSASSASAALRKLAKAGWVRKGSKGRYGQTWWLTEAGFAAAEATLEKHHGSES